MPQRMTSIDGSVTIGNQTTNPIPVASPAVNKTPIAAGTVGNTIIKGTPGTFYGILVTGVAVGTPQVFDNAVTNTGTIVGTLAASAPLGLQGFMQQGVQCANGIVVGGGATNPAMTVFWL